MRSAKRPRHIGHEMDLLWQQRSQANGGSYTYLPPHELARADPDTLSPVDKANQTAHVVHGIGELAQRGHRRHSRAALDIAATIARQHNMN